MIRIKNLLKDDSGAVMVLVALALVVLLGCMALVIDAGVVYAERMKASNVMDAAVLAGVSELPEYHDDPYEYDSWNLASQYIVKNGFDPNYVEFIPDDPNDSGKHTSIKLKYTGTQDFLFARVLGPGFDEAEVKAAAKARVGNVGGFGPGNGVIPIGIDESEMPPFTEGSNPSFVIKEGGGGGDTGWYGYVNIDGKNITKDIVPGIQYGSENPVSIGQVLPVVPGNKHAEGIREAMSERLNGCTHDPECGIDGYVLGCRKIVYVPIGYKDDGGGATGRFTVTGFAALLLVERWEEDANQAFRGEFLQHIAASNAYIDDSAEDFGVYATELCE
ncbi:MAG TPA: hypothetical protein DER33_10535 [Syntrophomonas sp.]|jgi:hypothetical protein|nr:hypothetical protein [Syntrophomonas sp.]